MPVATDRIEWPSGDTAARVLGASTRRTGAFASGALRALALLYGVGVRARNAAYDRGLLRVRRARVATISVGNIVAGGAGKTPFTRWLVAEIAARGKRVAVLHGGYTSDEPALHRQWQTSALVYEERDRFKAAQQAAQAGVDVVVLDDAFQHRRLARDADVVLVPAETHSARLLPAGPLREPERALARADLLVVTRKTAAFADARALSQELRARYAKPCAIAGILPDGVRNLAGAASYQPAAVVVVSAIARPDLLLTQLTGLGIHVVAMLAYPDHHEYTHHDVARIEKAAGDMPILCTEKDAVKLTAFIEPKRMWVLQQKVVIEDGMEAILAMLERVL